MSKLREDFRVVILGAGAGLFAISLALLIARIDAHYAYLTWLKESHYDEPFGGGVERLEWIPFGIWHLILSISASLLVHRYLATRLRSPFLLWQVIGIGSLLGWGLTVGLLVSMRCLMDGDLHVIEHLFNSNDLVFISRYLSTGFACSVFYGSVMKACSRQYTPQFDELAYDSASVDHLLKTD